MTSALAFEYVTIGVTTVLSEEYAACKGVFDPREEGREVSRKATSGKLVCWLCSIPAKTGGVHIVAITLLADMGNSAAAIVGKNTPNKDGPSASPPMI